MNQFRMLVVALVAGLVSTVVFLLVVLATVLLVFTTVGDDQALVTWAVLIGGAVVGWFAARLTHTRLMRWVRS